MSYRRAPKRCSRRSRAADTSCCEARPTYCPITQKVELLAFKHFREEYESYLDYLLGDDRLLMQHRLERIDKMYYMRSILRLMVQDPGANPPVESSLVSRHQILKDKLLIELIENPKKLWKHLTVKVRNAWISRVILCRRLKSVIENKQDFAHLEGEEFKEKFSELLSKLPFKGANWEILRGFLAAEVKACKNWVSLSRSLKSLERNAFKTYFYSSFAVEETENSGSKPQKQSKSNGKGRIKMRSLDDF